MYNISYIYINFIRYSRGPRAATIWEQQLTSWYAYQYLDYVKDRTNTEIDVFVI